MALSCPTLMLFLRAFPKIWDYGTIPEASPHPARHHTQPTTADPKLCWDYFALKPQNPPDFNIFKESCS